MSAPNYLHNKIEVGAEQNANSRYAECRLVE